MAKAAAIRLVLVTRDVELAAEVEKIARATSAFELVGMTRRVDEAASLAEARRAQVIVVHTEALKDVEKDILDLSLAAGDRVILALVPMGDWEAAQKALIAGARGFLSRPLDPEQWKQTLSRVVMLDLLRHAAEEEESERADQAPVITVVSPKGGTGRTFLAANLAAALHSLTEKAVLVMEAMSLPGDLAVYFSTLPKNTLAEVARLAEDLSLANVDTLITAYRDGLYVLPSVLEYTAEPPEADDVRMFLRLARRMFDYIVVDTGELQDPLTEVALKEATVILLVVTPDLSGLYRTSKFLAAAQETGVFSEEMVIPVLNMEGVPGSVSKDVLRRVLGRPFAYSVPFATDVVHEAQRHGEPVVLYARGAGVSKRIYSLASDLVSAQDDDASSRPQAASGLTQALRTLWEHLRSGPAAQWHGLAVASTRTGGHR